MEGSDSEWEEEQLVQNLSKSLLSRWRRRAELRRQPEAREGKAVKPRTRKPRRIEEHRRQAIHEDDFPRPSCSIRLVTEEVC